MERNIENRTNFADLAIILLLIIASLLSPWSSFSELGFIAFLGGSIWDYFYKLDHWHTYMIFMVPMFTAFLCFFTYELCSTSLYTVCMCNISICSLLSFIILIEIWIFFHPKSQKVIQNEKHEKIEILPDK